MMSKRKRVEAFIRWLTDTGAGDPVVHVAWGRDDAACFCRYYELRGKPHIDVNGHYPTMVVLHMIAMMYVYHMQHLAGVLTVTEADKVNMVKAADAYAESIVKRYTAAIKATKRWRRT